MNENTPITKGGVLKFLREKKKRVKHRQEEKSGGELRRMAGHAKFKTGVMGLRSVS